MLPHTKVILDGATSNGTHSRCYSKTSTCVCDVPSVRLHTRVCGCRCTHGTAYVWGSEESLGCQFSLLPPCLGQDLLSHLPIPHHHSHRLAVPELPRVSCLPSPPHVLVGTLGLQSHDTTISFTWVLGIQTQVLMRFPIKPPSQPHITDF